MMGSNEKLPMDKKVKTLRKLGISEAGIRNVQRLAALPHFFDYDDHGTLNRRSPVDGTPVAPHAPSRKECDKRANDRTYRLKVEKEYQKLVKQVVANLNVGKNQ
jgi:hypothetical protein